MARRLNQTQLKKELGITDEAIDFIRERNIIRWSKVGRQIYFDGKAIETFKKSFDIRDHLTIDECAQKLKKHGFYSQPASSGKKTAKGRNKPKLYENRLGMNIYITVKTLIDGSNDTLEDGRKFLPDEYRLEVRELGKTIYIERDSFAKTLKWIWKPYPNDKTEPFVQWVNVKPKKKKARKKGIRGLKNIKTARKIVGRKQKI